jgi:hypothetical protein
MRWILDFELLLLISCIARKWNRAKIFFVRSHSLPKNPFLLRQEISQERGLWLLNGDYKKMCLPMQTYLGGQSYCSLPFNPPNPVSSGTDLALQLLTMASKQKWQKWWWRRQLLHNEHPCLLLGQSSDCCCCYHSFCCRRCHFYCRRCCHDHRHHFFCCCLLLFVVAIAVALLPLLLLSPSHLPLLSLLLIDFCLYPSAAITASSSSPHSL